MLIRRACRVLIASVLLGAWGPAALTQTLEPKTFRVQLKVSADPELKGLVQKAMEDELRGLAGVLITDASPEYTVSVIALKVVNQSSRNVGATFSVLVTEPYADRIRQFSESHLTPEASEQLAMLLSGAVRPRAHWVETASASDVLHVSRSIVQSFARDTLRGPSKFAGLRHRP